MVAESQALRRACAKFGLGRHLYDQPAPWVDYDAERKTIRPPRPVRPEAPAAAQPRPQAQRPTVSPARSDHDTLGRARAATMHRELARLGLGRSEHQALARQVLNRGVSDFAGLTEADARRLWRAARTARK